MAALFSLDNDEVTARGTGAPAGVVRARDAVSAFVAAFIFQAVTVPITGFLDRNGEYGSPFISGAAQLQSAGRR